MEINKDLSKKDTEETTAKLNDAEELSDDMLDDAAGGLSPGQVIKPVRPIPR